ncbi:MAG: deoxyribodipyrimidine photo-lyase, partial [Burkholderiales bacterium]
MAATYARSLFWFRRDLRAFDNAALHAALLSSEQVFCVFVFDREILDALEDKADRRVEFIWESIVELRESLRALGGELLVRYEHARDAIPALAKSLGVDAVFTNHDFEPQATVRDAKVRDALAKQNIAFETRKDHVIFERDEVLTQGGKFFSVFTPYKNAWLKKLETFYVKPYPIDTHRARFANAPRAAEMPSLESMDFARTNLREMKFPTGASGGATLFAEFVERMDRYADTRDFPAVKGPSYLSTHLRFGTVSIRALAREAWTRWKEGSRGAEVWLSELVWRDFYVHILHHNPHVVNSAFKPDYDAIRWSTSETDFAAWCEGKTG